MRILINATSVRLGGGITVIKNLLPALLSVDEGRNEYLVSCRDDVAEALDPHDPRVRVLARPARRRATLQRLWWEQVALPQLCGREAVDVMFSPAGVAALGCPVPQILMFQNMAPFEAAVAARASRLKRLRLDLLRWIGRVSARRADRVVFISDYVREHTVPQLGIRNDKTRRIYLGRDPRFRPMTMEEGRAVRESYGLGGRYLLSVSQFYHYKNFVQLVHGFARVAAELPQDVVLAIAGAEHEPEYAHAVRRAVARCGLEDRVRLLGQVPYESLPAVYAGASLFLFPSTCESFPNILIEALSSGVPTLSSRAGPMPELARSGAAYFDPFDPGEIAGAIRRAWHDPIAARELAAHGLEVAGSYSWERTAEQLLDTFTEVLRDRARGTAGADQGGRVAEFFDVKATPWTRKYREHGALRSRLSRFGAAIGDGPTPRRVLDVGCGTGDLAAHLAASGNAVIACDISSRMLAEARTSHREPVEWVQLEPSWTRLPFGDATMDVVTASSVVEYVDDLGVFAREVARVLKPGGLFVATLPNTRSLVRRLEAVAAVVSGLLRVRSWTFLPRVARFANYLVLSKNRMPARWWTGLFAAHGFELLYADEGEPLTMMRFRRREPEAGQKPHAVGITKAP